MRANRLAISNMMTDTLNPILEPSGESGSTFDTIGEYIQRKLGAYPVHDVACPGCGTSYHPVAVVKLGKRWRCGHCKINEERQSQVLIERSLNTEDHGWDSEYGNGVKAERNALLEKWAWTIRMESPLSEACQANFLQYLRALNRLTVNFSKPCEVVFPALPELEYELEGPE